MLIRKAFDAHLHLRSTEVLGYETFAAVVDASTAWCDGAIIMPNLPAIETLDALNDYRDMITGMATPGFTPQMSFKITPRTTPEEVKYFSFAGAIGGKLYPDGVTTASENGVRDFESLYPVFGAMSDLALVLMLHGEHPDEDLFCLDREAAFLEILKKIRVAFPQLRIVLEHVSTMIAVHAVEHAPDNVGATITPHHLLLTLNDVVEPKLAPHNFCKPLAKRPEDRYAIVQAATSGNPKFFFGTDSAPWLRELKECAHGCAGIFNAPVALPVVTQVFEDMDALSNLEAFIALNGPAFYGLTPSKLQIELVREPWTVPAEYHGIVPFRAGETLNWQVQSLPTSTD